MTEHQPRLTGFIVALVVRRETAFEILQETNLALWKKRREFDVARPFAPWALAVARLQVLAASSSKRRNRLVFDEDVVTQLATQLEQRALVLDARQEALAKCLQLLPADQRSVLNARYADGLSASEVADQRKSRPGAINVMLHRIRQQLRDCIEKRLGAGS